MQNLKKPLKLQLTNPSIIGKRPSYHEVEDQSLHTTKKTNDLENLVVKGYFPGDKPQINFFDHVQGNDPK